MRDERRVGAMSESERRRAIRARALRAAMVVSTSVVLGLGASGCERVRGVVMDGDGLQGERCQSWSIRHGSPESCCRAAGGYYTWSSGTCSPLAVPGPFVPPSMRG